MTTLEHETELAARLEDFLATLDRAGHLDDSRQVVPLGSRQANAQITVDGITYALTLTRED